MRSWTASGSNGDSRPVHGAHIPDVATYALFVLGTSGAWNIFMLALKPERGLLRPDVPLDAVAATRRRVRLGFVFYAVIAGLALVNAYLGLGPWWPCGASGAERHTTLSTGARAATILRTTIRSTPRRYDRLREDACLRYVRPARDT